MSARYVRRSVEGFDNVENDFSQIYIKVIKNLFGFWS